MPIPTGGRDRAALPGDARHAQKDPADAWAWPAPEKIVACGCDAEYRCPDRGHCFACEHEAIHTPGGWTWRHPVYIGWRHWKLMEELYYYNATSAHKYSPHFPVWPC